MNVLEKLIKGLTEIKEDLMKDERQRTNAAAAALKEKYTPPAAPKKEFKVEPKFDAKQDFSNRVAAVKEKYKAYKSEDDQDDEQEVAKCNDMGQWSLEPLRKPKK